MQKPMNTRDRGLSLLLGGVALVILLRRSWLYATLALGCAALLYQALSGRYLFSSTEQPDFDFTPAPGTAAAADTQNPNIDPQLDSDGYDQIDEQSFQSFPASDPPATRIG